jgi:hypothetical protein
LNLQIDRVTQGRNPQHPYHLAINQPHLHNASRKVIVAQNLYNPDSLPDSNLGKSKHGKN